MTEQWKDIPSFEGLYQASNTGHIRSAPNKVTSNRRYSKRVWKTRILKTKVQKNKKRHDERVTLWKDGKSKDFLVSRLVAMAWVDGYRPELTVNHIDGNTRNNNCMNLEWVSIGENVRHAFATGLCATNQKEVKLVCADAVVRFPSLAEASRYLGRNNGYVHECIKLNRECTTADGTKRYKAVVN